MKEEKWRDCWWIDLAKNFHSTSIQKKLLIWLVELEWLMSELVWLCCLWGGLCPLPAAWLRRKKTSHNKQTNHSATNQRKGMEWLRMAWAALLSILELNEGSGPAARAKWSGGEKKTCFLWPAEWPSRNERAKWSEWRGWVWCCPHGPRALSSFRRNERGLSLSSSINHQSKKLDCWVELNWKRMADIITVFALIKLNRCW